MYVTHENMVRAPYSNGYYYCSDCSRYISDQAVKEVGWRWSKRTRRGRHKIQRYAHIYAPDRVWF